MNTGTEGTRMLERKRGDPKAQDSELCFQPYNPEHGPHICWQNDYGRKTDTAGMVVYACNPSDWGG